MRKRLLVLLAAGFLLAGLVGVSQAALVTIGTASYGGTNYKLIYDDDDTGYGGGGLVWFDYKHPYGTLAEQKNWASGLGGQLAVTLTGYRTNIDWSAGWRLPDTVNGPWVSGFEGDPDNDGLYSYTGGYNLANSEMGHLFYTELGNTGYQNTDGSFNTTLPPLPNRFLLETGDFDYLVGSSAYWSGAEYVSSSSYAWLFYMGLGEQAYYRVDRDALGLAVHEGQVSAVPIPGAFWLLGSGLFGLVAVRRRKKG